MTKNSIHTQPIPLAYIHGAESSLLSSSGKFIGSDDVLQLIATIRSRLAMDPSDPLSTVDALAAQFGVMEVDASVAQSVLRVCKYPTQQLKLVEVCVG